MAGLLGIGGGPVYIIIFSEYLLRNYSDSLSESHLIKLVIANAIFATLFASVSGCFQHIWHNNFYLRTVRTIAIPAIIFTLLTTYIISQFEYSKTTFSIIFIVFMVPLLYKMITEDKQKKKFNQPYNIKVFFLNLVGMVSGIATALTGLGGGFVIIPLLNSLFNIKIRKVISISLGVILVVSLVNTIYNILLNPVQFDLPYSLGAVSLGICLPVIIGVMVFAPLGVLISKRLSPYTLRLIFVSFCGLVIFKTVWGLL